MNKWAAFALATAFAVAPAFAEQAKRTPDMTVFGIEMGKPLTIPQCSPLDFWYKPPVCHGQGTTKEYGQTTYRIYLRPQPDYIATDYPEIVISVYKDVVSSVGFFADEKQKDLWMSVLRDKYGPPRASGDLGASWQFPGLTVGVFGRVITIETPTFRAAMDAARKQEDADREAAEKKAFEEKKAAQPRL
jgi:hypothetical protein